MMRETTKAPAEGASYLTVKQVARRLSISLGLVYHLVATGQIVATRPGGRAVRISPDELARFERASTPQPVARLA